MIIWVVSVSDSRVGVISRVFTSSAEAHDYAWNWCEYRWNGTFPNERMPDDWQTAYNQLKEETMDYLTLLKHEVEPPRDPLDSSYVLLAKQQWSGSLEFDDEPVVSQGEGGAFVQAWIWVDDDELGIRDQMKRLGYRITTVGEFAEQAPKTHILRAMEVGCQGPFILWSEDPDGLIAESDTEKDLMIELEEYLKNG